MKIFAKIVLLSTLLVSSFSAQTQVQAQERIYPDIIGELSSDINGTSGLFFLNDELYSFNDHKPITLYSIDTLDASIKNLISVSPITPIDLEEIQHDDEYIYFGDFGNNNGNRRNLHILKTPVSSCDDTPCAFDTIFFYYEDQTDFTSTPHNTDFDCEAFIVGNDNIYLFTKEWKTEGTTIYSLPKTKGSYAAHRIGHTSAPQGLITGASFFEENKLITLCGYNKSLQPFILLLFDYSNNFLDGKIQRISIDQIGFQIEGIASHDKLHYFLSNEYFSLGFLTITPKLQKIDLSAYLKDYLFPSGENIISIDYQQLNEITHYKIYDTSGHLLIEKTDSSINFDELGKGLYIIETFDENRRKKTYKIQI